MIPFRCHLGSDEAASQADPKPDPVRERILVCAEKRFLTEGFSRITMDDLANELGMSKKTLYRHFASKESLLEETMARRMISIRKELEAVVLQEEAGFMEKLRGAVRILSSRTGEVQQPFLSDIKKHAPEMFAKLESFRSQFIPEIFGRLIESGRREGMIREDLNRQLIVEVILRLIQSHINPDTVLRLGMTLHSAFDNILSLVFEGVMTSQARLLFEQSQAEKPASAPAK